MLKGETITTGASDICPDCGEPLPFKVCSSVAGFYIGTWCDADGPYSRESGYYPTREAAEAALQKGWPARG